MIQEDLVDSVISDAIICGLYGLGGPHFGAAPDPYPAFFASSITIVGQELHPPAFKEGTIHTPAEVVEVWTVLIAQLFGAGQPAVLVSCAGLTGIRIALQITKPRIHHIPLVDTVELKELPVPDRVNGEVELHSFPANGPFSIESHSVRSESQRQKLSWWTPIMQKNFAPAYATRPVRSSVLDFSAFNIRMKSLYPNPDGSP